MNIYLIQRGKIRSYEEETKKGIDKILSFDYMGLFACRLECNFL